MSPATPQYDSIIIGAGHNGLTCAAYLARAGQRVLVLEAADAPGGLAAAREFHPGFQVSVAHSISHFPAKIARDLDLAAHGFTAASTPLPTIGLGSRHEPVVIDGGSLSGVAAKDVSAFADYLRLMQRIADVLAPFWLKTMPRIGTGSLADMLTYAHTGLSVRRLGRKDMREFMRIAALPARDLLDEFFDDEVLKAALSWDGLIGSKMAPRSPNSAVLTMLYRMAGSAGAQAITTGDVKSLVRALEASAKASGAEVRCSAAVDRVLVDENADGLVAAGVQLQDGEKISARNIISATDPRRTFLNLVGVEHLEIGFTNRIRRLRCDGYVAKLHLALSGLPAFDGLASPGGRMIVAPDMDTLEFAYDAAKYGELPEQAAIECFIPSIYDASLAPAGQHVLSAHVMYVPHALKGGWTESARDDMRKRAIDTIAEYAPRIREQIVHSELLTPADLEQQYRVSGGHWHHGDMAMDQLLMMRPTYEAAQYRTPIPGLFLCSAGCHPGGDLTGAAGHNAAREILR